MGKTSKNAEKRAPRAKNSLVELCPVRNIVARFGNKWSLLVILLLDENGVLRFNELSRLIPDVSSRVLSGTLRMLEADGLVDRQVYPVVPPRVEYRLTASVGICGATSTPRWLMQQVAGAVGQLAAGQEKGAGQEQEKAASAAAEHGGSGEA